LIEGDRLSQREFHRRYEATPPGVKAELIDGVVFMPSPATVDHGFSQTGAMLWLAYYASKTPGVGLLDNATTILGRKSEPQPDVALIILPECGGQTAIVRRYLRGAPELVLEVAKSSRYIDLGPKHADYTRAGVLEYVVRALDPDDVIWFQRVGRKLERVEPDADGLYRSTTFPGLWLDPAVLLSNDLGRLCQVVERGVATPEHAAFVARLAQARPAAP
jgi:hypothetical protein